MKSLKQKVKNEAKTYRRKRESVARRASVPLEQLLPRDLYRNRPSALLWEREQSAFSDANTVKVALASYALAATILITICLLTR
jgi:hypothetical protein